MATADAIKRMPRFLVVLAIAGVLAGCSVKERSESTSISRALTTSNGLNQNGLTTNGLVSNGFWANGFWANGFWANGFWANGFWANGFWANGFWANGFWANGFWANGFWANGLTGPAAVPGDILRNSPYARELLQYIYSCAMPATTYDTAIDPNKDAAGNGGLPCSASDAGADGGGGCDAGYSCVNGECVIPLQGGGANGSGLGVNADGTTWWGSGTCDETCQRWVSACVLARTNAYGVHVEISLRAPSNAPQAIRDALAVTDVELHGGPPGADAGGEAGVAPFSLREGAYYGNIFATTPTTPPPAGGNGPATGPIALTPSYYACAGPDSNTPEITKRFCSSQGDQSVINVPGVCWPPATGATEPPVCDGIDTTGSIFGCYTSADPTVPRTHYDEVVTVYLQQRLAVCGNSVCESPAEDATSCPSDCHPTGWARSFPGVTSGLEGITSSDFHGSSALSPIDGTIVLVGESQGSHFETPRFPQIGPPHLTGADVSLGGPLLPGTGGNVAVAKYTAAGDYVWGTRVDMPGYGDGTPIVAVGGDGSVIVSAIAATSPGLIALIRLAKLTSDGQLVSGWPIALGVGGVFGGTSHVAVDAVGNIFIAGFFLASSASFENGTVLPGGGFQNIFVARVRPDGTLAWAVPIPGGGGNNTVSSLTLAPSGDLLLAADLGSYQVSGSGGDQTTLERTALYRLSATNGASVLLRSSTAPSFDPSAPSLPPPPAFFKTVAADGSGDLFVTGHLSAGYDFGSGCGTAAPTIGASEFFVARFSPDGSQCRWVAHATTSCPPGAVFCANGIFDGGALSFDHDGNVVVGGVLDAAHGATGPGIGAIVDFGAGPFPTYRYPNPFVVSYRLDGSFLWAKQIPIVLQGNLEALSIDSVNNVFVSGIYTGSMQIDDRLLVDDVPELNINTAANTYIGSFAAPSTLDHTPPGVGAGTDQNGVPLMTVPSNIYVPATSAAGAVVFYLPPTAIDEGDAGVSVACSPPPNTTFPIGTTTVTCTASDPVGNSSSATFTVTVVDTLGPAFSVVAHVPPVQATSANGANVTYPTPTATDQVDGPQPVTCTPASSSLFAVGTTTVTCTAADTSGHQSETSFPITVTPPPYGGPCASAADCLAGVACVDGVCCNTTASCGQCQACNVPGSLGTCTPTSGGACNDHNACTTGDTCSAGTCVGGPPPSCDDQNPCTTDACDPASGCLHTPGNPGALCRGAANACDSAETCDGANATCPANADHMPPTLNPGTNQTVVGSCSSVPVAFAPPALANSSCEGGTSVTCTALPGNGYGAHTVSCTAKDASGNVSAPVSFTVTVLQPLTIRIQPPLSGDNDTVDNVVKCGSTVPNKILLYACGVEVTKTASVTAKLSVSYKGSGGASVATSVPTSNGVGDANGVMVFDGTYYHYNLDTKGLASTAGVPAFYQESITVAYNSAPGVVVGSDSIQLDTK